MTEVVHGTLAAIGLMLASVVLAGLFVVDCAHGRGWSAVVGAPAMVLVPALLGRVLGEVRLARRTSLLACG